MLIRLLGFAIAGLIAGVLSCALLKLPLAESHDKVYFFVGALLGIVLPLYLGIFAARRSWWRALVFLIASTCAYYIAMTTAMISVRALHQRTFPMLGVNREETMMMLVGGFLGAAILYLAFALLYCLGLGASRFFTGWVLTALLGAVIALLSYALGLSFAPPSSDAEIYTLYIIWQAVIAAALGYSLLATKAPRT